MDSDKHENITEITGDLANYWVVDYVNIIQADLCNGMLRIGVVSMCVHKVVVQDVLDIWRMWKVPFIILNFWILKKNIFKSSLWDKY